MRHVEELDLFDVEENVFVHRADDVVRQIQILQLFHAGKHLEERENHEKEGKNWRQRSACRSKIRK